MQPQEVQDGDFQLIIHGEGNPRRMFFGGASYRPKDYFKLVKNLPGTNFIVDNPDQAGRVDWNSAQLRQGYERVFNGHECEEAVVQSLGCREIAAAIPYMPKLQRIVFLAAGLNNNPQFNDESRLPEELRLADSELAAWDARFRHVLPRDLPFEQYLDFLMERKGEIDIKRERRNTKKWIPDRTDPGEGPDKSELGLTITEIVGSVCDATHLDVLLLIDFDDPWIPQELPACLVSAPHITIKQIPGRHYPHWVYPKETAEAIQAWESR